jgi:hypothetical protein
MSEEVVHDELKSARAQLAKWVKVLDAREAAEKASGALPELKASELAAELSFVSAKLSALSACMGDYDDEE